MVLLYLPVLKAVTSWFQTYSLTSEEATKSEKKFQARDS